MAAGLVNVAVSGIGTLVFWSSDGTSAGNLSPAGSAPYGATALGYEQITDLSAAVALTVPTGATFALIQAESVDVRWRDDGTNPTASVGVVHYQGEPEVFAGPARLAALRFIQLSASATLNISYYK